MKHEIIIFSLTQTFTWIILFLTLTSHGLLFLTQTSQTYADAHTLRLCLPSGWWRKRSVRFCEFFIDLNNVPHGSA